MHYALYDSLTSGGRTFKANCRHLSDNNINDEDGDPPRTHCLSRCSIWKPDRHWQLYPVGDWRSARHSFSSGSQVTEFGPGFKEQAAPTLMKQRFLPSLNTWLIGLGQRHRSNAQTRRSSELHSIVALQTAPWLAAQCRSWVGDFWYWQTVGYYKALIISILRTLFYV